jgi:shikimate kinase
MIAWFRIIFCMEVKSNLILIGMPGSGKSTIGRLLAGRLGWPLVDTDRLIEADMGQPLQEILDRLGPEAFIRLEAAKICALNLQHHVIATGGSVVLDAAAMEHLRTIGWVIYLDVPLHRIERRLWNLKTRGIVIRRGQTIRDVYRIRRPLYERYADCILPTAGRSARQVVDDLLDWLAAHGADLSASSPD